MQRINKAVFPVAGMGTRFLPATKASPKEMLPVVDKPLIQYAAEEAVAAGINTLIFITGRNKRSIEDHFDKACELEAMLEAKRATAMLDRIRNILLPHISCVFIRQAEALGLGHAVLCARPVIGNEPFAVLLADDLVQGSAIEQMLAMHEAHGCSVLGIEEIPEQDVGAYGIIGCRETSGALLEVDRIVEKPALKEAPSRLAVVGRYLLTPQIFPLLEELGRGAGGEIQLTDAIARLITNERVLGCQFKGRRFDCGSKLGYLQAQVELALAHAEIGDDFREYLKTL